MRAVQSTHFARAVRDLTSQSDVSRTVGQIMRHAPAFTAAAGVGVMRLGPAAVVQIVATSLPTVQRADELQLAYQEGPCLQASRSDQLCRATDIGADARWPVWGPAAAGLGWSAILSLPLQVSERPWGALNLYAPGVGSFDDHEEVEVAQIFARYASAALTLRVREERLREAVTLRHVVGQAQGILMERHGVTAERALAALQRQVEKSGLSLHAVAERVVDLRVPDPAEDPGPTR